MTVSAATLFDNGATTASSFGAAVLPAPPSWPAPPGATAWACASWPWSIPGARSLPNGILENP